MSGAAPETPLAERLRPTCLGDIIGQDHLTGPDGIITRMVTGGRLSSLILWGPPGCGKTSIARLLADAVGYRFVAISAIFSSVAELKKLFAEARDMRRMGEQMLLFVDEIHRFNRAQLDAFLPVMEDGTIILVGATTQNPSFELNSALLSRAQLLILQPLSEGAQHQLAMRCTQQAGRALPLDEDALCYLISTAQGDGRFLINQLELLFDAVPADSSPLDAATAAELLQRRAPVYDKDRDGHFNLISALHKAMRGSDGDAALYYLARMLVAGEDPLYVLRRITRFASEDVGLADPQALSQCIAALHVYQLLGSPEGELAIAQACLYCATAPKSNATYLADKAARKLARETGSVTPPANILNAPTKLMKDAGYGAGYIYDHDTPDGFAGQSFWPETLPHQTLYAPSTRGHEKRIAERLAWWAARRKS
ncbi:MAG: replication-associated recombination protein A [Sphingopyxis sp.]